MGVDTVDSPEAVTPSRAGEALENGGGLKALGARFGGEPLAWWLGLVVLLLMLRLASEGPNIPGVPAPVRVNLYNIMTVGAMAVIFIVVVRVLNKKLNVPGLGAFMEAV